MLRCGGSEGGVKLARWLLSLVCSHEHRRKIGVEVTFKHLTENNFVIVECDTCGAIHAVGSAFLDDRRISRTTLSLWLLTGRVVDPQPVKEEADGR